MIDPRILVVHNEDVCRLLTQKRGHILVGGVEDDDGDFMRCCMGRIVIQDDHLMVCHLDCAYMAYHPDLSRHLPKLKVLIARKACLSIDCGSQ